MGSDDEERGTSQDKDYISNEASWEEREHKKHTHGQKYFNYFLML